MGDENIGDEGEGVVTLPAVWVGLDELTIIFANQFLIQISAPNEIVVAVGQSTPPPFLGTPEERLDQARSLPFLPVRSIFRFAMNRSRLDELIKVLSHIAIVHDEKVLTRGGDES